MLEAHRTALRAAIAGMDPRDTADRIGGVLANISLSCESGLAASILLEVAGELQAPAREIMDAVMLEQILG